MVYAVKEIYRTLQGEGAQSGRVAVFCRFARCNLWSGHEQDRARAVCQFCDTDFVGTDGRGGGTFETADALADAILEAWSGGGPRDGRPCVVFTGGEPALQLDEELVAACHARGLEIAVETNGTQPLPPGIDWVTVSPKARTDLVVTRGQELKLVWPQEGIDPEPLLALGFAHHFLQPMDGAEAAANRDATIAYCLAHPRWRLSLQTHKLLGLP